MGNDFEFRPHGLDPEQEIHNDVQQQRIDALLADVERLQQRQHALTSIRAMMNAVYAIFCAFVFVWVFARAVFPAHESAIPIAFCACAIPTSVVLYPSLYRYFDQQDTGMR